MYILWYILMYYRLIYFDCKLFDFWFENKFLQFLLTAIASSSRSYVFFGKGVLKIYSKFTWEHPCRNVISIKLLCNLTEITLRHVDYASACKITLRHVSLLHILGTPFPKNTYGGLLLHCWKCSLNIWGIVTRLSLLFQLNSFFFKIKKLLWKNK